MKKLVVKSIAVKIAMLGERNPDQPNTV